MTVLKAYGWILLVPAALAIGWGIGQLPAPEPAAMAVVPAATDPPPATVAAGSEPPSDIKIVRAPPARAAAPRQPAGPRKAPVRNELSEWTTLDLAIAESRRNGKPVLIDFNADWCPPCRRMKQEVFEDGAHAATVRSAVIPVSIVDRAREEGQNPAGIEDLQREYRITAFPTLIVFSPATGRAERAQGYRDAGTTVAWITSAARSVR